MHLLQAACIAALTAGSLTVAVPGRHHPAHGSRSGADPQVRLDYATYQGKASSDGINKFLGMRYAQAPLGDLRFRGPREPLKEDGIIEATEHGNVCVPVVNAFNIPTKNSEDCLFIDVYTPENAKPDSNLPVMVWIQGGAFIQLINPNYDGTGLIQASDSDMVVVTFNYRVGPYGFLASESVRDDGDLNAGLLDQQAALQWVQKHIRAFGGDPDKVTLTGTSIGGGSVLLHMLANGGQDASLFRAGIAEAVYMPPVYPVEDMEFQYQQLLNATTCDDLACLRRLSTEKIQEVNVPHPFPGQSQPPIFPYGPVIDGKLLSDRPMELLKAGKITRKPLLIGTSMTEGTFVAPQANTTRDITKFLGAQFPDLTSSSFRALNDVYQDEPRTYPGVEVPMSPLFYRAAAEYGDASFSCPAYTWSLGLQALGIPVFTFLDHILDPVEVAAGVIVPHTWELAAVWGPRWATQYVALPGADGYEEGGVNAAIVPVVQAYWTSFIRTGGNPNRYRRAEAPRWQAYGPRGRVLKLQTNATEMQELSGLQCEKCSLWASLVDETHH